MATTAFGVNHPLAVKHWSRALFQEAIRETYVGRFIGTGKDSLIVRKDETSKDAGDKITFGLRVQLTGDGVLGDGTLEGNEEALTTYSDAVYIDQLRHAVRSDGKMSEQRVPFSVRSEAKDGLRDWWSNRFDTSFFNQICGYTAQTDVRYTGNQSPIAPTNVIYAGSSTDDQTLNAATTDVFKLELIDAAVEKAETMQPLIRPIMIGGEKHYVMFLHDYQVTDLRQDSGTGKWYDIQKAAMQGGKISDNPIFTGALGMYNNVILHKANRVTVGVHSTSGAPQTSVRRAVLCGAQAACMAFGQGNSANKMSWTEELFDYGNQLGVSAGSIFGLKKTVFNNKDFGTVVVATYAVAHT